VRYLCANFSLPRPLCSRVRPDVRDRQTSDVRQKHRLMPPPYGGGCIKAINREIKQSVLKSRSVAARWATLPIAVVFEPFHLTSASRLPHDISLLITDTWCRLRPAFCLSVCLSVSSGPVVPSARHHCASDVRRAHFRLVVLGVNRRGNSQPQAVRPGLQRGCHNIPPPPASGDLKQPPRAVSLAVTARVSDASHPTQYQVSS